MIQTVYLNHRCNSVLKGETKQGRQEGLHVIDYRESTDLDESEPKY